MEHYFVYIALVMLLYCMFSAKISAIGVTMPMVFLALGIAFGLGDSALNLDTATAFHDLAEITLALLLFADATSLHREALMKIGQRTRRMLFIGLPLAIVFGAMINLALLPDWPFWEACLLAALLAPTDAALGQSIQANTRIPQTLRDTMNAESGLNDGLSLPFVLFFAGMAVGDGGSHEHSSGLLSLLATQIGIGAAVGLLGGYAIGRMRNFVLARNLMEDSLSRVATLVVVAFVFFAAEHAGGNSFVAVFVAGIAYSNAANSSVQHARHFLEGDGQFFAMFSFFFIGALFVPEALAYLTPVGLLVVVLSLVVVRPLAIWLSLIGTKTSASERLFYGWFGPRGLATALFAVFVAIDFKGIEMIGGILVIAFTTVLVSAFVHGISAKYAPDLFRFGSGEESR
ncbi:MAG: sodium:proton antiporter [Rhizobiaceae bacterium MnEN-MB40S]|nr:MAG: sodium:proton antiporter [Rhizobiaceae bacterium MnEN-MB40S]